MKDFDKDDQNQTKDKTITPAPWRTSRLAIGRGTGPPPPWTTSANGTMWPPGSWRIWGPTARMV